MAAGGRYQKLEEQEKELSKELARLKTKHDLRVNNVKEAEVAVVSLQTAVAEVCPYLIRSGGDTHGHFTACFSKRTEAGSLQTEQ